MNDMMKKWRNLGVGRSANRRERRGVHFER